MHPSAFFTPAYRSAVLARSFHRRVPASGVRMSDSAAGMAAAAGLASKQVAEAVIAKRTFSPEHAAGAGSGGRHRQMFDHKHRSPPNRNQEDKLFDSEEYERCKPAAFLGSSKKRVEEADARMFGTAPDLGLASDTLEITPDEMFDSKRQSAARPADHLGGSCSGPAVADPFMVARAAAFASCLSGDGLPHRFGANVATETSIPGSRLGRGVYTPADNGNILSHDTGSAVVEERLFSTPRVRS